MFDGNKELKEFVMTLTGSLVFGPNGEITPLSARTTDRSIIRAMMEGGTAKIYHCNDSDKCLKVVADTPVTISRDNALKLLRLLNFWPAFRTRLSVTRLDDKEKGFISSTTIPVFKYLVDPQMLRCFQQYDLPADGLYRLRHPAASHSGADTSRPGRWWPREIMTKRLSACNDNMNDATRAAFQCTGAGASRMRCWLSDRQISCMRQQLSARMLSRYQNNYHFGGRTVNEVYVIAGGESGSE